MESKRIVIYYSYSGNTKKLAEYIQKETNGDIAQIEVKEPYTGSYNEVVEQAKQEIEKGFCPQLKEIPLDLQKYDTIILGTPVWWYTCAPAISTFLKENDLSGKTIIPFATNGGWIGHTGEDIVKACPKSVVKVPIDIYFDGVVMETSEQEIDRWIKEEIQ